MALLAEQPSHSNGKRCAIAGARSRTGHCFFQCPITLVRGIPALYQAMIRTGKLTGKLDEYCFELARQQKAQRQLTDKVKSALRLSHHHFSDGNHGGCGNAAFCSAGVCRYL
ncbi:hypothetical protein ACLK1U_00610 [Escherichia coli]